MLSTFIDSIIEQSKPEIIDTAIRTDFSRLESNLSNLIRQATTWRTAITTNLVAWLLYIAITFLVVVAGVPGWLTALIAKLNRHP